ncbi:MAG: hypothetical protein ACYSTF_01615 [Planctomycetota bacterium]|jgi:hypothetical protein
MFSIDLLKGEGIPAKTRPEGVVMGVIALAVPILVAIAMIGIYLMNGITISIQKRNITQYAKQTEQLSETVEVHESLEREKGAINSSMSEVASSIGRHTQWSPVIATLVRNMPASLVLTKLEVEQKTTKKRVPSKADPDQMVPISIPKRTLRIKVCGSSKHDCDGAIKSLKDKLRLSSLLGPKLEAIRVAQEHDILDGQPVISYTINCVFKPGL